MLFRDSNVLFEKRFPLFEPLGFYLIYGVIEMISNLVFLTTVLLTYISKEFPNGEKYLEPGLLLCLD